MDKQVKEKKLLSTKTNLDFFFTDRTLRPAGEEHYMLVVAISDLLSLSIDEAMILLNGISQITGATMHTLN